MTEPAETTVAARPAWARSARERPTWGLEAGEPIAPGRTVLVRLGGGSRYEVFLVWDEHHLAVLVAKVLRPDEAIEPASLRELGREAGALSSLAHPVIVRCFDAVLDGRHPHLLIEHLEGPTLRELLEAAGPPSLEQLLPLALHLASALHYMAAEGWVHLDVKPENVVMGAPPRLIDLSVARTLDRARRLAGPTGTDAYMAPEVCAAHATARAPGRPPTCGASARRSITPSPARHPSRARRMRAVRPTPPCASRSSSGRRSRSRGARRRGSRTSSAPAWRPRPRTGRPPPRWRRRSSRSSPRCRAASCCRGADARYTRAAGRAPLPSPAYSG
jgi:serine/threonine protein kinase